MFGEGQRVRSMGLKRMDDRGQSNIDFLFGLGVFLVTFIYAVTFIPGLFVPYQSSSIDLSSVAYRTAAILVEDPGWYIYNGSDGISNSSQGPSELGGSIRIELARIGLADNSMDRSTPNMLSIEKINMFNEFNNHSDASLTNYTWARDRIGLNGSVIYDFNAYMNMTDQLNREHVRDPQRDQSEPEPYECRFHGAAGHGGRRTAVVRGLQ